MIRPAQPVAIKAALALCAGVFVLASLWSSGRWLNTGCLSKPANFDVLSQEVQAGGIDTNVGCSGIDDTVLPSPVNGGPEKVLVCIIGSTRSGELTWESFQTNFTSNLIPGHPENVDLALAIHLYGDQELALSDGRVQLTGSNPFLEHAKYVWIHTDKAADWGEAMDGIRKQLNSTPEWRNSTPDWRLVLQQEGNWCGGFKNQHGQVPASGGALLFFRWFLMKQLSQNCLLNKYHRFVVTRADFYYPMLFPPLSLLSPEFVWFPRGEWWGGLPDRQMIIPAKYLRDILDMASPIILDPDGVLKNMTAINKAIVNGETHLAHHLKWKGLSHLVRFYPYVMYLTRGSNEATRWGSGGYNEEAGKIVKYPTEWDNLKQYLGKIKSNEDWSQYMASGFDTSACVYDTSDFLAQPCQ